MLLTFTVVRIATFGLERVALDLEDRRLAAPVVDVGAFEGIADGAEEVAGMLGGELVAEGLIVLPGGRGVVAESVEQCLVVPEQHRREVVAKAIDLAVDRHGIKRAGREAIEERLIEEALVQHLGKGLHAVGLFGGPGGIVVLGREHHVRPAFAGLVGEGDLGLEGARGAGRAVVDNQVHLDLGMRGLERLDGRLAGRVGPDGDFLGETPALATSNRR